ncbi:hypothetical protein PHLGIDRAFT_470486 [Phlebiopsis gigantea 11061_1 CR5-6]|uniref:Uncharacterized protein n=1 Tax=Phlebiopsis gigantea (strain 11061_1 CR5-6) TaxID=745531 RepID=A0A0C3S6C9_PHLG1|nr:hypothetical protein PHLGIDRAFT_470486 [Phlebiopsis gigantea 11061_1 CR5-6]
MDDLRQYTSALAQLKGAMSTSSYLPPNVVLQILTELVHLCSASTQNPKPTSRPNHPSRVDYPHQWLAATHVCRQWRNIALGCSILWTRIIWCGIPARVEAFLTRSGKRRLYLEPSKDAKLFHPDLANWRYGTRLVVSKQFIAEFADRICSVSTLSLVSSPGSGPSLPVLEHAHIVNESSLRAFSTASMPKLIFLELSNLSISNIWPLLQNTITCLHITGSGTRNRMRYLNLPQWVHLLDSLPQLRELDLRDAHAIKFSTAELLQSMHPHYRATMKHLRRVNIYATEPSQLASCAFLLTRVASPLTTHISIRAPLVDLRFLLYLTDFICMLSYLGAKLFSEGPPCAALPPSMSGYSWYCCLSLAQKMRGCATVKLGFGYERCVGTKTKDRRELIKLCMPVSPCSADPLEFDLLRMTLASSLCYDLFRLSVERFRLNAYEWLRVAQKCSNVRILCIQVKESTFVAFIKAMKESTAINFFPQLIALEYRVVDPVRHSTADPRLSRQEEDALNDCATRRVGAELAKVERERRRYATQISLMPLFSR